ncbi:MAG: hypothetical protein Ct9H300mP12_04090 [Acidimicrobiales bacterium]|nr:MAG: hypothetical protein Ct9H300mP12_04090 [Acidimicrobiales bacterium]
MARTVATDALSGYEITEFAQGGTTRTVLRAGSGPAVIVMPEMPGSPSSGRLRSTSVRHRLYRCYTVAFRDARTPSPPPIHHADPGRRLRVREFTAFLSDGPRPLPTG